MDVGAVDVGDEFLLVEGELDEVLQQSAHLLGVLGQVLLFGLDLGCGEGFAELLHVVGGLLLLAGGVLVLAFLEALLGLLLVLFDLFFQLLGHLEIRTGVEVLVVLLDLVDVLFQLLETAVQLLLFLLQLLVFLAFSLFRFTRNIALFLGQAVHVLDGLLHLLLQLQTLHQFDVLVELFLEFGVVHLELFQFLLHLVLVQFLHHAVYLRHGLLHLLVHHLVHQAVQLALFFHELFALLAVFLLQAVVLLDLLLHLLHHLAHLLLFLLYLLEVLLVLPVELLLVHQAAHHLVDFLLQFLQFRHLVFCALAHLVAAALQQLVQFVGGGDFDFEHLRLDSLGAVDGVVVGHLEPVGEGVAWGEGEFGGVEGEEELLRCLAGAEGHFGLAAGLSGGVGGVGRLVDENEPGEAVIVLHAAAEDAAVGVQGVYDFLHGD